jgi:hypothetical protein
MGSVHRGFVAPYSVQFSPGPLDQALGLAIFSIVQGLIRR